MHPLDILFWACLILGSMYTLVTFVMGGLSDLAGHAEVGGHVLDAPDLEVGGHDVGDLGTAGTHFDTVHGGAVEHAGDAGHSGSHVSLLGYLSPLAIAGFLIGFGGVGVVSRMAGAGIAGSLAGASAGGLSMWAGVFLIIRRMFGGSQGTSHYHREELIGCRGQATTPITADRPGMISITVGGTRQTVRALTDEEEPIPTGATVRIRKVEENTVRVTRVD